MNKNSLRVWEYISRVLNPTFASSNPTTPARQWVSMRQSLGGVLRGIATLIRVEFQRESAHPHSGHLAARGWVGDRNSAGR
jgi:hypothetical protein